MDDPWPNWDLRARCHLREAPTDPFRQLRRSDRRTWPTGLCDHCGNSFARSQRSHRYCSARCRSAASEARRRPAPTRVSCERCGTEFERSHPRYRYCSARCQHRTASSRQRLKDPQRERERWRAWYRRNKEKVIAYVRAWRRENPDRVAQYERRRRAARLGTTAAHTLDDVLALFEAYEWRCGYCGSGGRLTIDHLVPLSRGGSDASDNLMPACIGCNSSKHDRSELEFRAETALSDFITSRVGARGTMDKRGAAQHRTGGPC